jgi:hypothetical protein
MPRERRRYPYRSRWPNDLHSRLYRAQTEQLSLLHCHDILDTTCDLIVSSSNGTSFYNIHIGPVPTCTCPDFTRRRDLCKHIIFVNTELIGLPVDDPRSFQRAYVSSELRDMMLMLTTFLVLTGFTNNYF